MDYKEVFQLAESKGCEIVYPYHNLTGENQETLEISKVLYLHLCLCQKWLRDKHKIFVEVMNFYRGRDSVYHSWRISFRGDYDGIPYANYEEALLHGIKTALELI